MKISDLFRRLLCLYPADFRQEFSEEMCQVFEKRAKEYSRRGTESITFALRELSSIAKGACIMRIPRVLASCRSDSEAVPVFSSKAPADIEEATQLRSEAIKKMVAFIARNDFERARQCSWDEVRLHRLIRQFQGESSRRI